jgi:long-chain acyl-CoA synthetase
MGLDKFEKARVADEALRDYQVIDKRPHYFQCLTRHAESTPNRAAIIYYGREITYRELDDLSNRFAAALRSAGVKKGDRVGVFMENCPQFWICFFAAQKIGAVSVFLNPMNKGQELEYYINSVQLDTIVAEDECYPVIENITGRLHLRNIFVTTPSDFLPEIASIPLFPGMNRAKKNYEGTSDFLDTLKAYPADPIGLETDVRNDPLFIVFTAGTTGLPKGIVHTHYNLNYHACVKRVALRFYLENSATLVVLPLFHLASFQYWNPAFYRGSSIVLLYRWDAASGIEAISRYQVTIAQLPVTQYEEMMNLPNFRKYNLSAFEIPISVSFGRTLTKDISEKWEQVTGHRLNEGGYGMSETLSHDASNFFEPKIPPILGKPTPGTEFRIVDIDSGEILPIGKEGKVLIRTPSLFKEYWNDPEQTVKSISQGGWFDTGDIGKMDEEGYFYFLGRVKEMIKVSGWSVFPEEVESLMKRHPAVKQVAVIGVPDPKRGEVPKGFIVLNEEFKGKITEKEMIDWCRDNISAYKYPRRIEFRDSLPAHSSGKLRRLDLKKEEEAKKI